MLWFGGKEKPDRKNKQTYIGLFALQFRFSPTFQTERKFSGGQAEEPLIDLRVMGQFCLRGREAHRAGRERPFPRSGHSGRIGAFLALVSGLASSAASVWAPPRVSLPLPGGRPFLHLLLLTLGRHHRSPRCSPVSPEMCQLAPRLEPRLLERSPQNTCVRSWRSPAWGLLFELCFISFIFKFYFSAAVDIQYCFVWFSGARRGG